MVLGICAEGLIRMFFVMLKFLLDNWGWAITILVIGAILQKIPFLVGIVADGVDFFTDILADIAIETILGSLVFAGIGAIVMSLFWTLLVLTSQANVVLRIINAPIFFVAGAIVGAFPIPLPGLTVALGLGLKNQNTANFVCFAPVALIIFAAIAMGSLFGTGFCEVVNNALILVS